MDDVDLYYRRGLDDAYKRELNRVSQIDRKIVEDFCSHKANKRVGIKRLLKVILFFRIWRNQFLPDKQKDCILRG